MGYARPTQLLWFVGAAVFILALFHSLGENTNSDWIANIKVPSHAKATRDGQIPLKQFVKKAEGIWGKTIVTNRDEERLE
jgi:hypothetical protein